MNKRLVVLFGCAEEGFYQKDILDFYAFLNSEQGGFWNGCEIALVPQIIDAQKLNRIFYELFSDHIDFLCAIFAETETTRSQGQALLLAERNSNLRTSWTPRSIKLRFLTPAKIFIRPNALVIFLKRFRYAKRKIPRPRIFFAEIPGNLFFTGCRQNSHPVLSKTGSGVYTNSFLAHLNDSKDGKPDFFAADKNANFECEIARCSAEMMFENEKSWKI